MDREMTARFVAAARKAGAEVCEAGGVAAVVDYLAAQAKGTMLCPPLPGGARCDLVARLRAAGIPLAEGEFRSQAPAAAAGLTGADFAIAATGTVVVESTSEAIRLASTLPPVHFVLLDPRTIVADSQAAVPLLRRFHEQRPQSYLAYITGPSRTADIERVLTIGVHGPKELHILLCEGVSADPLES